MKNIANLLTIKLQNSLKLLILLNIFLITVFTSHTSFIPLAIASVDRPVKVHSRNPHKKVLLRSGAGNEYDVINSIPNGTILSICTQCEESQDRKDRQGNIWYFVFWDTNGKTLTGWVQENDIIQDLADF